MLGCGCVYARKRCIIRRMERRYPISYPSMALGHRSEDYQRYPKLLDIERETIQILQGIPLEQAVDIALAVQTEKPYGDTPRGRSGDDHIPAVVVFSREGVNPENVWKKLLIVLRTPDFETPSYDPEARPLIDALKGTLLRSGYSEGVVGAIASAHMIRVAGGDPAAINWVYRDMGRRYPVCTNDWYETLEMQFEGQLVPRPLGSSAEQEMVSILSKTLEVAQKHDEKYSKRRPGEGTIDYFVRTFEQARDIFNIVDVESLGRAATLMDKIFLDYRQETYALRGIPYAE